MKVKELYYNWHPYTDDEHSGEDYHQFIVGRCGVVSIKEETQGGSLAYLVEFEDGRFVRVFNPNRVEYFAEQS